MYEEKQYFIYFFILLLCIGLQYETIYYGDGSISGAEYGLMSFSISSSLFLISGSLFSLPYWEKMGIAKEGFDFLSLLGDVPFLGWVYSFAYLYP